MRRLPKVICSVPGKKCYCSKLLCAACREEEKEKKNETQCLLSATRMAEVIVHYSTRDRRKGRSFIPDWRRPETIEAHR